MARPVKLSSSKATFRGARPAVIKAGVVVVEAPHWVKALAFVVFLIPMAAAIASVGWSGGSPFVVVAALFSAMAIGAFLGAWLMRRLTFTTFVAHRGGLRFDGRTYLWEDLEIERLDLLIPQGLPGSEGVNDHRYFLVIRDSGQTFGRIPTVYGLLLREMGVKDMHRLARQLRKLSTGEFGTDDDVPEQLADMVTAEAEPS